MVTMRSRSRGHDSLFHTVIEHFVLFRAYGEYSVERETILLRPGADLRRTKLNSLQVVIEGDNDVAAFS